MTSMLGHLNWFAIAVAVIAYFILGGVWFSLIVNRAYIAALGRAPKSGGLSLLGPFLCLVVTTITSAMLLRALEVTSLVGALEFGSLVGIGYLTPMTVNIALNPLFPRPLMYSAINAPFFILGSLLVSVILVAMG